MNVVEINNPQEWDFILRSLTKEPSFLQSSAWAECLQEEGKNTRTVVVEENGVRLAAALLVATILPFGWRYATCSGGPVVNEKLKPERIKPMIEALCAYVKRKQCIFLRIEPTFTIPSLLVRSKKVPDVNPATTTVLDLQKPFPELLLSMHKKTRSCLRKAAEAGLEIKSEKNLDSLMQLLKNTGSRDGFRLHPSDHYAAILASKNALQLTAYHNATPVATAVWFGFASTLTYLFAASDHNARDLNAPYALQEAAIKYGQTSGYQTYDFFGIAPKNKQLSSPLAEESYSYDEKHAYAGITQFKIRFGGVVIKRPGTYDLLVSPFKYTMYRLLRKIRRLLK